MKSFYATMPSNIDSCIIANSDALSFIRKKIEKNIKELHLSPSNLEGAIYTLSQLPGLSTQTDFIINEYLNKNAYRLSREEHNQLLLKEKYSNGISENKIISLIESGGLPANSITQGGNSLYERLDLYTLNNPNKTYSKLLELGVKSNHEDLITIIARNQQRMDDETLYKLVSTLYQGVDLSQAHLLSRYNTLLRNVINSSKRLEFLRFLSDRGLQFNKPIFHEQFFTEIMINGEALNSNSTDTLKKENFLDIMLRQSLNIGTQINEKSMVEVLDFMASKGVYPTDKSILEKNLNHRPGLRDKLESVQENIKPLMTLEHYVVQNNINTKKFETMMGIDDKVKQSLLEIERKKKECKKEHDNEVKQWKVDNKEKIAQLKSERDDQSIKYQLSVDAYKERQKNAEKELQEWVKKNQNKKNDLRTIDAYLISKDKRLFFVRNLDENNEQSQLYKQIIHSQGFHFIESGIDKIKAIIKDSIRMQTFEEQRDRMTMNVFILLMTEDLEIFEMFKEERGFDSDFYIHLQEAFKLFALSNETLPNSAYFKKLESLGVDLYRTDDEGGHLLSYAVMNNDVSLVDYLLKNKKSLKYNADQINALDIALIQFTPENKAVLHSLIKANYPMDEFHKQLINRLKKQYPKAANKIL